MGDGLEIMVLTAQTISSEVYRQWTSKSLSLGV